MKYLPYECIGLYYYYQQLAAAAKAVGSISSRSKELWSSSISFDK